MGPIRREADRAETDRIRELDLCDARDRERRIRDESARRELLTLMLAINRSLNQMQAIVLARGTGRGRYFRTGKCARTSLQSDPLDGTWEQAQTLLIDIEDPCERWLLTMCFDLTAHWDDQDTAHGYVALIQLIIAQSVGAYAAQTMNARAVGNPLPSPPMDLRRRLPQYGAPRVLQHAYLTAQVKELAWPDEYREQFSLLDMLRAEYRIERELIESLSELRALDELQDESQTPPRPE